jgi:hypothetical protein
VKGKEENIWRHEEQEGARIRRPQLAAGGAHQRRHYKQQAQKQKQKQKRVIKKLETKSKITKNTRGERRKESKRWKKKHLIARAERKRKQDMEEEGQLQE